MAAAEILGARFGADGVFVGMPTRATSDPMFSRVRKWSGMVADGPQVALLHGKRIGVVLTFAGLTLLAAVLLDEGAPALPILALVSFGLGAALFLVELAFRATVLVSVATASNDVPSWFPPLQAWAGAVYWAYMPLAYLGVAATGGALLHTAVLGSVVAWTAIGFGLLGAAAT